VGETISWNEAKCVDNLHYDNAVNDPLVPHEFDCITRISLSSPFYSYTE